MSNTLRVIINIAAFLTVIGINALSNALPLNGLTQQDLSRLYPIYLTPSPYVFSIWGLIYIGLLGYIIYQALPSQRDNPHIRALDLPFLLSCLCNSAWIFTWHYRFVSVSVLCMLGILGSLILAYLRINKFRSSSSGFQHWIINNTFSLYLAWVSLATILNISIWLYVRPWRGGPLSEPTWAAIMLVVAIVLFSILALPRRDTPVFGVLAWATFGIQAKHAGVSPLSATAWIIFGLAMLLAGWCLWQNHMVSPKATPPEGSGTSA